MIFLSILAKTWALALAPFQPWGAAALWAAGLVADLAVLRRSATPEDGQDEGGGKPSIRAVAQFNFAALVAGIAAAEAVAYAAMRWKAGIPVLSHLVGGLLNVLGQPAGVQDGRIFVTNMAGPLEFSTSIDLLDLPVPVLFLALAAVWLLLNETRPSRVLARLGAVAAGLLGMVVVRTVLWVLLVIAASDFVSYESDELPYRPFVDPALTLWLYLPLLLAGGPLLRRVLPSRALVGRPAPEFPRSLKWAGPPVLFALLAFVFWQPAGTPKQGTVVIDSFHTQWSQAGRPYDRDWYGADSGYNYACLKRLFETFHPVVLNTAPITAGTLEDASILVLYVPDRAFTAAEQELVQDFVRRGGGLLVIGDHTNVFGSSSNLNALCEPFGLQFRDDVLFDLDEDFHQVVFPPRIPNPFWHGMAVFKLRGPASIEPTSLATRCVYRVDHAKGFRAIYSVNNFYPPPHDHPRMTTGEFCVAASARHGRGRVAAWADSTVFSNFEIFYPGKYEYLANTLDWLNHRDGLVGGLARRLATLAVVLGLVLVCGRWRDPRLWLATLLVAILGFFSARAVTAWRDGARAEFPRPAKAADWILFAAHLDDPGHHLVDFTTDVPYDQRYEVFIQWVLRTGAFSGYYLLGAEHVDGFYEHLRAAPDQRTALALIVRSPEDLPQLAEIGAAAESNDDPLLLLFASTVDAGAAIAGLEGAGIVGDAGDLARLAAAWPSGEAVVDAGGRRVMVVAGAERFSDQRMGISEKVRPDAEQRARFDEAFGLIDRFLGRK